MRARVSYGLKMLWSIVFTGKFVVTRVTGAADAALDNCSSLDSTSIVQHYELFRILISLEI